MELSWDAVGAIAESVGAVAVLLTFAYLAVQIRQNAQSLDRQSDIARAQIQQNRADTAAQMVATITSVPENVDVYVRLLNESNLSKSGLSDVENARMTSILGMFRAQSENTFLQYEQGFLPEDFYRDVGLSLIHI